MIIISSIINLLGGLFIIIIPQYFRVTLLKKIPDKLTVDAFKKITSPGKLFIGILIICFIANVFLTIKASNDNNKLENNISDIKLAIENSGFTPLLVF